MPDHTRHTFACDADAPFDRFQIDFCYHPGTPDEGPSYASGGTPGEPASVEWTAVSAEVDGVWHRDLPDWLADRIARDHEDDLFDRARQDLDVVAAFHRRRAA